MTSINGWLNSFLECNTPEYLTAKRSNAYLGSSLKCSFIQFLISSPNLQDTYVRVYPLLCCFQRNPTFLFPVCWSMIWNAVAAGSSIPCVGPSLAARLTLAGGVDGLRITIHFHLYMTQLPSSMLSETLEGAEKQAVVTGKGDSKCLLGLLGSCLVQILLVHFYTGHLSCLQYLAPEVIAVNPVIGV